MTLDAPANRPIDALIIGAGIAGLAAARSLVAAGRSVVVVEARARVGGRLDSIDGLDLGATWYWPNEPRIQQLITDLGVAVHEQYLAGDAIYHDAHGPRRLDGNPLDVPSGRFVRGADAVAQAIARELPAASLHLNTEVTAVVSLDDDVLAVETSAGPWTSRHVMIALPPALAVERIRFVPELPAELGELARNTPVWMGGITKVVVRYPEAFWRRAGLSGSGISHVGPLREVHDMSGVDGVPAALFGFVPARHVGEPTVTESAVTEQLVAMFGAEAADHDALHIRDWRRERHTSPTAVERRAAYEFFGDRRFAQPAAGGRLHWASSETSPSFPGHIEGALEAAERAATAIVRATRPIDQRVATPTDHRLTEETSS